MKHPTMFEFHLWFFILRNELWLLEGSENVNEITGGKMEVSVEKVYGMASVSLAKAVRPKC